MHKLTDVGLITWHYHTNVGSCLQAYALFCAIQQAGYKACFINYHPGGSFCRLKNTLKTLCANIAIRWPSLVPQRLQAQAYLFQKQFFEQTALFTSQKELMSLNGKFRMYLCGSDQIWAPNVLDTAYLLSFADEHTPKFSYASSIGLPDIPKAKKPLYKQYLQRFTQITVREYQGAQLLQTLLCRPIESVLDPTFLINKEQWQELALMPKISEPFLFCYLLGNNPQHQEWIEQTAQKLNLRVICATPHKLAARRKWIFLSNIGPRQFLGYLFKSKLVMTDSFHGMALSINLQKDFYVFERFAQQDPINQNSRIYNILDLLNLHPRLLTVLPAEISPIDYKLVNSLLQMERIRCLQILHEMLKQGVRKSECL